MKTVLRVLFAALLMLCALPLRAQTVHLMLPSGLEGRAAYHAGRPGQGAVLLHGFLQTGDFSTLRQLYDGLAEAGYTVLAPTITLGVPDRKENLDCGSLHLNQIDDEAAEVQAWFQWLTRRGAGPVYALGHSYGARLMIIWASAHPDDRVRGLLGVSLIGADPNLARAWTGRLEKAGAQVTVLPAASHFMNGLHQFALLDWVLARLRDTGRS